MNKKQIILFGSALISLACAFLWFVNWNAEGLFPKDQSTVTMRDIEDHPEKNFTGYPAGEDIASLKSAADFTQINGERDYRTAEPIGIISTDVYSLKPWVKHYRTKTYKRRTTTGSRKAEVIRSAFTMGIDYNRYYLLELSDHSYILAQLSEIEASAISNGDSIKLPIGQKVGLSEQARSYLAPICKQYGVEMNGVFYTFDNQWQKEHHLSVLVVRLVVSVVVWLVLSIGMVLLGNALFLKKEAQ